MNMKFVVVRLLKNRLLQFKSVFGVIFICNVWFLFLFSISLCFIDYMLDVLFASCAFTDSVSGLWTALLRSNK